MGFLALPLFCRWVLLLGGAANLTVLPVERSPSVVTTEWTTNVMVAINTVFTVSRLLVLIILSWLCPYPSIQSFNVEP